jgi:hypothetical protein
MLELTPGLDRAAVQNRFGGAVIVQADLADHHGCSTIAKIRVAPRQAVYLVFREGRLFKAADYLTVLKHHMNQPMAATRLIECESCAFTPVPQEWEHLFLHWREQDAIRSRQEDNSVLPAFILLAPLVVPAAVLTMPFMLFTNENESPSWPDVRLGSSHHDVERALGKPSDVVPGAQPLWLFRHVDHDPEDWPRSVLILRFRNGRVTEVLRDDFASIALRTEVDVPR